MYRYSVIINIRFVTNGAYHRFQTKHAADSPSYSRQSIC